MLLVGENKKCRILVLCTGNSARSIIAEALFNTIGGQYFDAVSAGSQPTGKVNPYALEQLASLSLGYEPCSQSWDAFFTPEASPIDVIVTVCDAAAATVCPMISTQASIQVSSQPVQVNWSLPDPAAATGNETDVRTGFAQCYAELERRIKKLIAVIDSNLDKELDYAKLMRDVLEVT
ncbi:MAG: arsenate reductase ArsC [Pseudomonadales bacterium]|nr:arsenate reductase ArsC [Pseudomonadales bacterium]